MFSLYIFLLIFALIILSPVIVAFLFFYLARQGFEYLELSPGMAVGILLIIFIASFINIPLTRKKMVRTAESYFFGLFSRPVWRTHGVSINLGGAVIPLLVAGYLLPQIPLEPVLISTGVVAFFSFVTARSVHGRGVMLPIIIPVIFAVLFALLLAPDFAERVAFVSGVLGVLIGADLLHLPYILRQKGGAVSIGGAGVFDGIFLVGVISALLAGM